MFSYRSGFCYSGGMDFICRFWISAIRPLLTVVETKFGMNVEHLDSVWIKRNEIKVLQLFTHISQFESFEHLYEQQNYC